MSNSYFQFKQFTVHQEHCAMKVSTDACIQGAWTSVEPSVSKVLDIGAGTGLLSLMLAQRFDHIDIDAVELDKDAAEQAKENIKNTPWSNRIGLYHSDIKSYRSGQLYDMIICNPPFFQNSLQSDKMNRNMARHTDSLSYKDLLMSFDRLLTSDGYASVMLPVAEFEIWENLLHENDWSVFTKLLVKPRAEQKHNRVISLCKRGAVSNVQSQELCIYDTDGYTNEFTQLLAPFYLKL